MAQNILQSVCSLTVRSHQYRCSSRRKSALQFGRKSKGEGRDDVLWRSIIGRCRQPDIELWRQFRCLQRSIRGKGRPNS
jgi:hypothetical protein